MREAALGRAVAHQLASEPRLHARSRRGPRRVLTLLHSPPEGLLVVVLVSGHSDVVAEVRGEVVPVSNVPFPGIFRPRLVPSPDLVRHARRQQLPLEPSQRGPGGRIILPVQCKSPGCRRPVAHLSLPASDVREDLLPGFSSDSQSQRGDVLSFLALLGRGVRRQRGVHRIGCRLHLQGVRLRGDGSGLHRTGEPRVVRVQLVQVPRGLVDGGLNLLGVQLLDPAELGKGVLHPRVELHPGSSQKVFRHFLPLRVGDLLAGEDVLRLSGREVLVRFRRLGPHPHEGVPLWHDLPRSRRLLEVALQRLGRTKLLSHPDTLELGSARVVFLVLPGSFDHALSGGEVVCRRLVVLEQGSDGLFPRFVLLGNLPLHERLVGDPLRLCFFPPGFSLFEEGTELGVHRLQPEVCLFCQFLETLHEVAHASGAQQGLHRRASGAILHARQERLYVLVLSQVVLHAVQVLSPVPFVHAEAVPDGVRGGGARLVEEVLGLRRLLLRKFSSGGGLLGLVHPLLRFPQERGLDLGVPVPDFLPRPHHLRILRQCLKSRGELPSQSHDLGLVLHLGGPHLLPEDVESFSRHFSVLGRLQHHADESAAGGGLQVQGHRRQQGGPRLGALSLVRAGELLLEEVVLHDVRGEHPALILGAENLPGFRNPPFLKRIKPGHPDGFGEKVHPHQEVDGCFTPNAVPSRETLRLGAHPLPGLIQDLVGVREDVSPGGVELGLRVGDFGSIYRDVPVGPQGQECPSCPLRRFPGRAAARLSVGCGVQVVVHVVHPELVHRPGGGHVQRASLGELPSSESIHLLRVLDVEEPRLRKVPEVRQGVSGTLHGVFIPRNVGVHGVEHGSQSRGNPVQPRRNRVSDGVPALSVLKSLLGFPPSLDGLVQMESVSRFRRALIDVIRAVGLFRRGVLQRLGSSPCPGIHFQRRSLRLLYRALHLPDLGILLFRLHGGRRRADEGVRRQRRELGNLKAVRFWLGDRGRRLRTMSRRV